MLKRKRLTVANRPLTGSTPVDSFLASARPHSFRYKDPRDSMSSDPRKAGGRFLGVIAQQIEAEPHGFGKQIVNNGPNGKSLEIAPLVSALTAGVGRLHDRLDAHEGGLVHAHQKIDHLAAAMHKLHEIINRKVR